MKFSVLLPTRNRLDLLKRAIETVRRQDYDNWEIVISDNCSEEDVCGYISSLNDFRIKYFRTESFVPVTDNWNNALEKSEGDYVIMLGDDDGLMKGYFSTLSALISKFDSPDFIYTNAFLYAYPGVMPTAPEGFLRTYSARAIFQSAKEPFWLDKKTAKDLVAQSLNFRVMFDYNMQFSLVSRRLIQSMSQSGRFYQSPYPDYYASNAILLKAQRGLIMPQPLVTIGISPKSFGYYYFNDAESDGTAFLKNMPDEAMADRLRNIILPGTDMNTSWLIAMETLAETYGLTVNYARYRELQIRAVYAGLCQEKGWAQAVYRLLIPNMSLIEVIRYQLLYWSLMKLVPHRFLPALGQRILEGAASHPKIHMPKVEGEFSTILDVFEGVDPQCYQAS